MARSRISPGGGGTGTAGRSGEGAASRPGAPPVAGPSRAGPASGDAAPPVPGTPPVPGAPPVPAPVLPPVPVPIPAPPVPEEDSGGPLQATRARAQSARADRDIAMGHLP